VPDTEIVSSRKELDVDSLNRFPFEKICTDMNGKSVNIEYVVGVASSDTNSESAVVEMMDEYGSVVVTCESPLTESDNRTRAPSAFPVTLNSILLVTTGGTGGTGLFPPPVVTTPEGDVGTMYVWSLHAPMSMRLERKRVNTCFI
jgi:hypothetical protein